MIDMVMGVPSLFLETLSLQGLFLQWQDAGIFNFLLPTILIFAVVFGILTSTKVLGESRGIHFLVSLAIALIAIQYGIVAQFFSVIFPNLGIGLAILLVILVLAGLFMGGDSDIGKKMLPIVGWIAFGGAIIIGIITLNQFDWFGSTWWIENWVSVIWIAILVLVMGPLLMPSKEGGSKGK